MKTHRFRLVTIIAEDTLEERLVKSLISCGVTGYTLWNVRGKGSYQDRTSPWEGENIQIESIMDDATADRVADSLSREFIDHHGFVLFLTDADVLRPGKFRGPGPEKGLS
jgi:nitrogen regulatory protein P-II 2